ncbi:MAG: DNA internalization-related competence protein ComEC/Rec2 [Bacteroidota bacterium]
MNATFLTRRPALRVALLLAGGVLLGEQFRFDPVPILCCAGLLLVVSLVLSPFERFNRWAFLCLHVLVLTTGISLHVWQREEFSAKQLQPLCDDERVVVNGVVETTPAAQGRHWSFVLRILSMERLGRREEVGRRVLVSAKGSNQFFSDSVNIGLRVQLVATVVRIPGQRNPGDFDYGRYCELNDIQGMIVVQAPAGWKNLERSSAPSLDGWIESCQKEFYRILDHLHTPSHASFLKGIILGYRGDISLEVKQSFMDTGTIHILAVSGSNVAVVALVFYSAFGLFRLPRKIIVLLTVAGLLFYMLVTGSSPSVVRATIMGIVILCATLFERKADIYNSLSVSAIILILMNTNVLFDPGFQLSFSAVLSIVYFYPLLEQGIKKIPEKYEEIKAIDYTLKLFAVSLAAQIGTIPFTAHYFGRVSLVSVLANLLVVPLSGLNTVIGFAELALAPLGRWLVESYVAVNDFLIWFLLGFVRVAARVPYAFVETPEYGFLVVAVYYAGTIAVANIDKQLARKWLIVGAIVLANVLMAKNLIAGNRVPLRVTALDVGQGDALFVEFPNGKNLLIDAGPMSAREDAGERYIGPFLRRKGVRSLDVMLVSHPHSDHIGGMGYLLKHVSVRTLVQVDTIPVSQLHREVIETSRMQAVSSRLVKAGVQISPDSGARLYVVNPRSASKVKNLNNASIALKLVYGATSILFVGDAEDEAEGEMRLRYASFLSSDILKAGHHGSKTSSGEEFLKLVRPSMSIVSVGTKNKFHHPSPEVLERMGDCGIKIFRTDKEGAVIFESNGNEWRRMMWRKE